MMPVGPLMIEHRLIERMLKVFAGRIDRLQGNSNPDLAFIDDVVDFIRTYADQCHHGKEEDILFREILKKPLPIDLKSITKDLMDEHIQARGMVGALIKAKEDFVNGESTAMGRIVSLGRELIAFYPVHIEKEDKHYFIPCMEYFTPEEQAAMLHEFEEFERQLIHKKYRHLVEKMEQEAQ